MFNAEYIKKAVGAVLAAVIAVPSIALGYYTLYQIVTLVGN